MGCFLFGSGFIVGGRIVMRPYKLAPDSVGTDVLDGPITWDAIK